MEFRSKKAELAVVIFAVFVLPFILGNSSIKNSIVNFFVNNKPDVKLESLVKPVTNPVAQSSVLGVGSGATCGSTAKLGSASMYVCRTNDAQVDVTEGSQISGNSVVFSQNCSVKLVESTYPAYWNGYDSNGDGEIDVRKGEWPDMKNLLTSTESVEFVGEDTYASEDSDCNCQFVTPGECTCGTNEGNEGTSYTYSAGALNGASSEGEIATPACGGDSSATNQEGCSSVKLAEKEANGSYYGGSSMADIYKTPGYRDRWEDTLTGESGPGWSCTQGDIDAPYEVGCSSVFFANPVNFSGVISDISCLLDRQSCITTEKFNLAITIPGLNRVDLSDEGIQSRSNSLDNAMDTAVYEQAPDLERQALVLDLARNEVPMSHDWPYSEDYFVETPALVSICGRLTQVSIMYKDYLRDYFVRNVNAKGVCDSSSGDICDLEVWWKEYVLNPKYSGGAPAGSPL